VLAKDEQLSPSDRENALRFGGTLYLMVNQPDKAKDCYEKLLKMAPDDMTSLNNMACLLAEVVQPARPDEGVKYSQHAYELMKNGGRKDALVLDTHGWLLTLVGKLDEGIDTLRQANEIKSIPDAHYHLAEAYLKKGTPEMAQRELEIAMDLIRSYESNKTPYDPSLKSKVEGAIARAGVMQKNGKKSTAAAGVSTGTNVP
jgi:tetratricopeptide (TPR) repeat protein